MNQDRQHMDHRWGTRVELHAPAELLTQEGRLLPASVKNASLSGAFVETDQRWSLFARVAVRPLLSTPGEWLEGCVVRVEGSGVALEWIDPGLHAVSTLLSLRPNALPQSVGVAADPRYSPTVTWIHRGPPAKRHSSRS
jgi:hypothetical protein